MNWWAFMLLSFAIMSGSVAVQSLWRGHWLPAAANYCVHLFNLALALWWLSR